MNLARALCFVGKHDLTTWRTADGQRSRHCKRPGCQHVERKAARIRKRPPTEADTVQAGP